MAFCVEAYAAGKLRVFQLHFPGAFVHQLHECRFASRRVFRESYAGVVRGTYDDRFQKLRCGHFLARFQPYHRAFRRRGVGRSLNRVRKLELTGVYHIREHQQRHHLSYRRHRQPRLSVHRVQHLPCFGLHQHRRFRRSYGVGLAVPGFFGVRPPGQTCSQYSSAQNAAQYFSEAFQRNSPFIVQAAFYKRYAVDQKKLQIFLQSP